MSDFKFQIGDWVKVTAPSDPVKGGRNFSAFRVVARLSDECPGGIQRSYSLRSQKKPDAIVLSMHEFEIEPWTSIDDLRCSQVDCEDMIKDMSSEHLCLFMAVMEKEARSRADEADKLKAGKEESRG